MHISIDIRWLYISLPYYRSQFITAQSNSVLFLRDNISSSGFGESTSRARKAGSRLWQATGMSFTTAPVRFPKRYQNKSTI